MGKLVSLQPCNSEAEQDCNFTTVQHLFLSSSFLVSKMLVYNSKEYEHEINEANESYNHFHF